MATQPAQFPGVVESELGPSIRACDRLSGGRIAETFLLTLDDQPHRVVCKIGGPSVWTGDVVEPLVMDKVVRSTDLPVPAVLGTGTLRDGSERRWAVYEFRNGYSPTAYKTLDQSVRIRLLSQIGSMLGTLHATHQYDKTGGFARANGDLEICDPPGLDFPETGRRIGEIHPTHSDGELQPVLSHGDLFPGNLLIDETGTITGLLDWGDAHVTTAGFDLGRAEMRFIDWFRLPGEERTALRSALREGYRQHRPLPPDYPELTRYYKGLWLVQSANRVLRHLRSARGRRQLKRHIHSILR